MADEEFEKLKKKLEQLEDKHKKVVQTDRIALIKRQYERFALEYQEKAECSMTEDSNGIDIILKSDSFLSCEDGGFSLNLLIGLANCSQVDIVDGRIVFQLWYRCWEWIEK